MPKLDAVDGPARTYAWYGVDLTGDTSAREVKATCPFFGHRNVCCSSAV